MKRKLVIKLLSITIVSAMLISNTVFLSAAENAPTGKADRKIEIVSEGQESLAEGFAERRTRKRR